MRSGTRALGQKNEIRFLTGHFKQNSLKLLVSARVCDRVSRTVLGALGAVRRLPKDTTHFRLATTSLWISTPIA
jgi:hypothetical protein